jgi:hypothetical protein
MCTIVLRSIRRFAADGEGAQGRSHLADMKRNPFQDRAPRSGADLAGYLRHGAANCAGLWHLFCDHDGREGLFRWRDVR